MCFPTTLPSSKQRKLSTQIIISWGTPSPLLPSEAVRRTAGWIHAQLDWVAHSWTGTCGSEANCGHSFSSVKLHSDSAHRDGAKETPSARGKLTSACCPDTDIQSHHILLLLNNISLLEMNSIVHGSEKANWNNFIFPSNVWGQASGMWRGHARARHVGNPSLRVENDLSLFHFIFRNKRSET